MRPWPPRPGAAPPEAPKIGGTGTPSTACLAMRLAATSCASSTLVSSTLVSCRLPIRLAARLIAANVHGVIRTASLTASSFARLATRSVAQLAPCRASTGYPPLT